MSGAPSVISLGSQASSTSSKGKGSKYRTVNRISSVDETLFARKHCPSIKGIKIKDEFSVNKLSQRNKKEPEVIQVITKDMIRKLRIPREDPSGQSLVLNTPEFKRIQSSSKVLTKREREALQDEYNHEKRKMQQESKARKSFMQKMELNRQQNEKLSELEQEAKQKSQFLLEKAQEQMEGQEDEIKKLNEVILNAKCHAIRDAQLIEKAEIRKELIEEEKRLDEMMEYDRIKALIEYEERDNAKRIERLSGARVLHQQIEENVQHNLLEQEKKDQETKAMLRYLERLKEEDTDALVKKRQVQKTILADVARSNNEIKAMKEMQKEREELEEFRVMQYLKEKEAREEAFEKEREQLRVEKEKEIARLRKQQERAIDKQDEQDALRQKRNQEEAEREWRRKEKEEAVKKAHGEEHLRVARQEQIANKEHFLAVQAARDRVEFERVLVAQRHQAKKDADADKEFLHKRAAYSQEVRNQIREKEKWRVYERQVFFQEGIQLDNETKERRQKLDEIKRRKLKELKEAGVPDKYVTVVARRIEGAPPCLSHLI